MPETSDEQIPAGELEREEQPLRPGEWLYPNGINGTSGTYDVAPMPADAFAARIQGESPPENLGELGLRRQTKYPIKPPNDPALLKEAGWAVIFPALTNPAIKEALWELLELRRDQAQARFQIYEGVSGYKPGETKAGFLGRHGVGGGPADPEQMPYYVLLVGSPEEIPYEFQYGLDVMRSVGRIHFDSLQDYANYAHNVVQAETRVVKLPRRAGFFGVANPDDKATELSARYLVRPLYERLQSKQPFYKKIDAGEGSKEYEFDWQLEPFLAEQATKAQLAQLLGGDQTPALLFTASHGMAFSPEDKRQLPHQGALLCQDWLGPEKGRGRIGQDLYFAGDDLSSEANLLGLITFHFACFSAGTPKLDQFAMYEFKDRREAIAPHSFLGALPTSLLRHGALAAVGHVERAWGYSFLSPRAGVQVGTFETALYRLLLGDPVGLAVEDLNLRHAELANDLATALTELKFNVDYMSPYDLAALWTANNDARAYVVLGDPAARIPFALPDEEPTERPVIEIPSPRPEREAAPELPAPEAELPTEETYEVDQHKEVKGQTQEAQLYLHALAGPQAFTLSGTVTLQPAGAPEIKGIGPYDVRSWLKKDKEDDEETKAEKKKLSDAIQDFIQNAAKAVGEAAKEAATLQIVTYTMDDLDEEEVKALLEQEGEGEPANKADKLKEMKQRAQPRAITRVSPLGDIQVYVPREGGEIDKALWNFHVSMVQQAQDNRNAQLRMLVEVLSQLVPG